MAALAGKGQKVLMAAVFAFHAGKAVVQIPAIQITVDDFLNIGTEKSIVPFKSFFIDLDKSVKMIFHATVIILVFPLDLPAIFDTNLFVPYLTNDDPEKADRVEALLGEAS